MRLTVSLNGKERCADQTLIIVPSHCVRPRTSLATGAPLARGEPLHGAQRPELGRWRLHGSQGARRVGRRDRRRIRRRQSAARAANKAADISPYSPVSRIFRNPIYIDVESVPELHVAPNVAARIDHPEFDGELSALRESGEVNYEQVMALKMPVLEELHRVFVECEQGKKSARASEYEKFVSENDPELTRFATLVAIAESRGVCELAEMAGGAARRVVRCRAAVSNEHAQRIDLHRWVQFELDRQLGEVANAARACGNARSDSIRISRSERRPWAPTPGRCRSSSFSGASVGAPPDPYSATGQNWGLPPIDPRALREDGYRYFIRLVRSGFRHAGALRIDHVLGLFRLFWIPEGKTGSEGAYVRSPSERSARHPRAGERAA